MNEPVYQHYRVALEFPPKAANHIEINFQYFWLFFFCGEDLTIMFPILLDVFFLWGRFDNTVSCLSHYQSKVQC